jgi:hypothetical protein
MGPVSLLIRKFLVKFQTVLFGKTVTMVTYFRRRVHIREGGSGYESTSLPTIHLDRQRYN